MLRAEGKSSFPASVAKRMVASLLLVETDMIDTHRFLHVVRWKINPKKVNDVANGSDVGPSPLGLVLPASPRRLTAYKPEWRKLIPERRAICQRYSASERMMLAEGKGGAECVASKLAQKLI